jgi:hypothetical protein
MLFWDTTQKNNIVIFTAVKTSNESLLSPSCLIMTACQADVDSTLDMSILRSVCVNCLASNLSRATLKHVLSGESYEVFRVMKMCAVVFWVVTLRSIVSNC